MKKKKWIPLLFLLLLIPVGYHAGAGVNAMNSSSGFSAVDLLRVIQAGLFIAAAYYVERISGWCFDNRQFEEAWKKLAPAAYLSAIALPYFTMFVSGEPLHIAALCADVVCSALFLLIVHKLGKNAGRTIPPGEEDKL